MLRLTTRQEKMDWIMTFKVNDILNMNVKLETGTQANVISEVEFKKIRPRPEIHATKVKVSGYSCAEIPVKGICIVKVTHKDKEQTLTFIMVTKNE